VPSFERAGARIHCETAGAGPPVLLIQGAGLIGEGWRPQIEALKDAFSLSWFDNRGIGRSTCPPGPLSIVAMAEDAVAVMDHAGVSSFHVVGHSMGGVIAQEVGLCAADRVRSLSLLCTFVRGRDATALTWTMLMLGLRTRIGTRTMRRRALLEMVLPPDRLASVDPDRAAAEMAPIFGHDLADQPPIVIRQLRALSRYEAGPRLATLGSIPTLVVSGELDVIARPSSGRALAAAIPGARYVELAGAAHGVPIYDAALINDLLRTFLART
jgi:pimeloyl-ACP methyl ester carboxylesterase